jgi:hypothetical protein
MVLICAACLALLVPLILFTPPRDSEVWIFQTILEMQEGRSFLPLLNDEPLVGINPLTPSVLALIPLRDIGTPRLAACVTGCLFISFVFLYGRSLYDTRSALFSSALALTSLGSIALFGTLNLAWLPVAAAAVAFGIFSLAYLGKLGRAWYIPSYLLAAVAAVTGGSFMLWFFLGSSLALIMLDLAPSRLFSIHVAPGAAIIAAALLLYLAGYRIAAGAGFTAGTLSPGDHLGLVRGLKAVITYTAPWIFLAVPAFMNAGAPSDKDAWRTALPLRTAVGVTFLLVLSHECPPQYAALMPAFTSVLTGAWLARTAVTGVSAGGLGVWMASLAGMSVFLAALVLVLPPFRDGLAVRAEQLAAAALFLAGAVAFAFSTVRRRVGTQVMLAAAGVALLVWYLAVISPEDRWERKISYMQGMNGHSPLVTYGDDLVMRGYLSAVDAPCLVVGRDAVPLNETAFLAVSSSDLKDLLEELTRRMHPVVLDTHRAENTYALVMVSPKKRPR